MDTRPFLLDVEKRWIAFQLLCAIATLNKVSLCHGDIKSENVLLTSWGWVLLTDFAPFKPVFLPDDNPADYSFYFDISGRRTCYIAPERFYHANRSSAYGKAAAASASGVASTAAVEPDADFGLSQKQQNVDLITTMLSNRTAESPYLAEELLIQQRGKAFPDYFYTFLKDLLGPFGTFRFAQSKLDGLKCLEKLACHLPDHIVLDRILPYILDMMTDSSSPSSVWRDPQSRQHLGYKYVNLFADYIFPTVEHLSRDVSVQVRSSLAEILGRLADTAKKFLDSVREQSMAAWLPPMEASDHVMSHAITFLNEGPDLRWSFYEQLYCMVAFIGDHGAEMLVPLLEQGLADPDPAVLVAALICLRSLVADRSSDVGRRFGAPLCAKSLPLLSHPDVFVRHAAAGLLCATAGRLGPAEFPLPSGGAGQSRTRRGAGAQRPRASRAASRLALPSNHSPRHLVERCSLHWRSGDMFGCAVRRLGLATFRTRRGAVGTSRALPLTRRTRPLLAKLGHLGLEESMEDRWIGAARDLALKTDRAAPQHALSTPSVSSAAVDYIGVERLKLSDLQL
uniref:Protein kinase domain-containing protein n=1 Tax=Macrostomum lignano TaxID=282301 RepID=A0A1I8FIJ4_9PLAT